MMSGECDKCNEHALECKCDKIKLDRTKCIEWGCRNLQTICLDCGRVVCTKTLPKAEDWRYLPEPPI